MATVKELRELSKEELQARASELKQTLFELKNKASTGVLDSTAELLKTSAATIRKAVADVLGRPLDIRIAVESRATEPPPAGGDDPEDLMRYALDKLR